jgi:hypothetical protein
LGATVAGVKFPEDLLEDPSAQVEHDSSLKSVLISLLPEEKYNWQIQTIFHNSSRWWLNFLWMSRRTHLLRWNMIPA